MSVQYNFGPTSYLTAAYGIADTINQSSFACYYKTTVKAFDLHFLAAHISQEWVGGFAFAGNVQEGNLYGELSYTWPEHADSFFRGTIGYQYNFKNGMLVIAEYYHNEGVLSAASSANTGTLLFSSQGLVTIDRNFLGLSTGFNLTPIIRYTGAILYDLDAGSFYLGPSFSYSAPHSITFAAGAQLFGGNRKGDFGSLPAFDWARLRWDF